MKIESAKWSLFLLFSMMVLGCATTKSVTLEGSETALAARGTVDSRQIDNLNNEITVTVEHLAPANKLGTGATTFVVWMQPVIGDPRPSNIGALAVTKNLEGSLKTLVAFDNFTVFVTAEPSKNVTSPSGNVLLKQRIDMK